MIASLPMYATPLTGGADARLWALIRDHLRETGIPAPDGLTLTPGDLLAHWRDPALLLSQTCGLPYRAVLRDHVTLIGTPDYGVKDCPPGYYNSVIIVRAEDPRDRLADFARAAFAYNDPLSQSGWAALRLERPEVLRGQRVHSGSHLGSARAVRAGRADFAAIDAVTWRHLTALSETGGLRIIHATRPTPGLPLITSRKDHAKALFSGISAAIAALGPDDRATLHLRGLVSIPQSAYLLPVPPNPQANPA